MKNTLAVFMMLIICSMALASQDINDGQFHVVDHYISGDLNVSNNSEANVVDGADIEFDISLFDTSQCHINGGIIGDDVWVYGQAELNVQGGVINHVIGANDESMVHISGGVVSFLITSHEYSYIEISGGTISDKIWTYDESKVKIIGYDFEINGNPANSMTLDSQNFPVGNLTGILSDNTQFNLDFEILHNSQIILHTIPEPTTFALFGTGGLFWYRRHIKKQSGI